MPWTLRVSVVGGAEGISESWSAGTREHRLKIPGTFLKYALIGAVLVYAVDWALFEVRQLRGTGMGSVQVQQYLSTALKGNKAEYDYLGTANASCSRTLFPQYAQSNWNPPCWWLERHREKWE